MTAAEFRQLGVSRLACPTGRYTKAGNVNRVIHGADDMAVRAVGNGDVAVDLAMRLSRTLVTMH